MSTPAKRRLLKDFSTFPKNDKTIFATPLENDLMVWAAIILGPESTPYENGTFSLIIEFSDEYPSSPPNIKFISDMYHPNIYSNGELCLDLLKRSWSPTYDVYSILVAVRCLLADPNIDSPANIDAAKKFAKDSENFKEIVKKTVEKSWEEITNELMEEMNIENK